MENSLFQYKRDYQLYVVGVDKDQLIVRDFQQLVIPLKILKLHGDLERRIILITPKETKSFPPIIQKFLKSFLKYNDLIMVGYSISDKDVSDCITKNDNSLIFVNPLPPSHNLYNTFISKYRSSRQIIGTDASFDIFMSKLCEELLYEKIFNWKIFINREKEIGSLLKQITDETNEIPRLVFEIKGIGGIGKSILLRKISDECRKYNNICWSYIDFSDNKFSKDIKKNIIYLIEQISNRIEFDNEIELENIKHASYDQLNDKLIAYLTRILNNPKMRLSLVLLFDSLEKCDQEVRNWIISIPENFTFYLNRIFFIFCSKRALNLESKLYQNKFFSLCIKEFNKEYSIQQIRQVNFPGKFQNFDKLIDSIHKITNGHPLANQIIAAEIQKNLLNKNAFDFKYHYLIKFIDQEIIKKYIFNNYSDEETNRFRDILNPLSIPRFFNLVIMKNLIEKYSPLYLKELSLNYSEYISLLQKEASFVSYSKEKNAYVVDPFLKNVFSLILKNEKPEEYNRINRVLIDVYDNLLLDVRGSDKIKYFLEKIYHLIVLNYPIDNLLNEFNKFIKFINKEITHENKLDTKQQFIEEFKLDSDLNEFFDYSSKNKINNMLL